MRHGCWLVTRHALRGSSFRWRSQRDVRGLGPPEQHSSFLEGRPSSRLCHGSQQRCRCTESEMGWGLRALAVAGRGALDRTRTLSQTHDQIPELVLDRGGRLPAGLCSFDTGGSGLAACCHSDSSFRGGTSAALISSPSTLSSP